MLSHYRHEMALLSLLLSHLGPAEQDVVAALTSSCSVNHQQQQQHQLLRPTAVHSTTVHISATVGQQVETYLKNVQ